VIITQSELVARLSSQLVVTPTHSQQLAFNAMAEFLLSAQLRPTLLVNGYAGTGKTTIMRALCDVATDLGFRLVLMAPTGRAAKVLSNVTGRTALTIHKTIYRQETAADLNSQFKIGYNASRSTIFIVDEASMISNAYTGETEFGSGRLLTDLISYVFSQDNCRLLLVGDPAQLPPVGLNIAPALDINYLQGCGLDVAQVWLTDVVRQETESAILKNAVELRRIIENEPDFMGFPHLFAEYGTEVERLGGDELIETLITCNDRYGTENTLVVTRSNKRATRFNLGIRAQVMFVEEEITRGDLLMVCKNNYKWLGKDSKDFIANGDICEVVRINGYKTLYDKRFADVSLRFLEHNDVDVDAMLLLDGLSSDAGRMSRDEEMQFFQTVAEDYAELNNRARIMAAMREDPYYNALQVKFAYAVTCHKAQGGQWNAVFVDIGYVADEMRNTEFLKWLYTAITRATDKLYLVNFPDEFFE
jgi:exodeoxyribonuclease-5